MAINKVSEGTVICKAGEPMKELYVIGTGKVSAMFPGGELTLVKGDVVGIQDIKTGVHSCTYVAQCESAMVPYPFVGFDGLVSLFSQKAEVMHLFLTASARFSAMLLSHCNDLAREQASGAAPLKAVSAIKGDAGDDTGELPLVKPAAKTAQKKAAAPSAAAAASGAGADEKDVSDSAKEKPSEAIREITDDATTFITTDPEAEADDIEIREDLEIMSAEGDEEDMELAQEVIPVDETDLPEDLMDSLAKIVAYSGINEEIGERFIQAVEDYKALPDKEDTDDATRKIRMALIKDYYNVYKEVFERTLESEDKAPALIRMFLTFGFVDPYLTGISNSVYLYNIIDKYQGDASKGVYTYPEWLMAIYEGRKEPSRNEFDLDYPAFLREQKSQGAISEKEMKILLKSAIDRVRFEIDNVFPVINKMTYGRITTFAPILSEHTLIKSLPDIITTPRKVEDAINSIKEYDFSAYYRETTYVNERAGVTRELIDVEVLPDVILIPNAGVRGAMWQEIEGKRRTTPARMMVSSLCLEDLKKLIMRMTGEFRWEMCKRIQGAHWNNIAERSLTSEYCDYIQFYRRNRELSPEAKEKIKMALGRAKNSMKEMFIADYVSWLTYESNGSPRLNKLAREILFTYCPFPSEKRKDLAQHPLYAKLIERYGIKTNQKIHHVEMVQNKAEKDGKRFPIEMVKQLEFLKM